ncbi:hypothetical protein ACLIYN_24460 [Streptomyces atacamensis]
MISQDDGSGRELVLVDGLSPADVVLVHREALRVLRSAIDVAHLDAYSDGPWPPAVLESYESALSLTQEEVADGTRSQRADPGMGIDIDIRDDAQFDLLLDLAPFTISAEGWRGIGWSSAPVTRVPPCGWLSRRNKRQNSWPGWMRLGSRQPCLPSSHVAEAYS